MAQITDIIRTLDELLSPGDFRDLGPNGLQVPGAPEVTKVVTAVSARRELSERAVELGAQLVLVHHGLFWDFHPTGLTPLLAERLRPLFKHDINLAAYHLPLDAHPTLGNNAILARELGCVDQQPFGLYKGTAIGVRGRFEGEGLTPASCTSACTRQPGASRCCWAPARSASARSGSSRVPPLTVSARPSRRAWTRS